MRLRIPVFMDLKDFGSWIAYKTKAEFNYYIFVEGINALFFIVFIAIAAILYVLTYKPFLIDPISDLKRYYLFFQFGSIFISVVLLFFASIYSKSKEVLLKRIAEITMLILICIVVSLGINIHMNTTYTQDKFSSLYDEIEFEGKDTQERARLDVKRMTIIQTQKEGYLNQNMEAYTYFKIKTFVGNSLMFLNLILVIYMFFKVLNQMNRLNKMDKDDQILDDDVQNVKI